MKIVKLNCASCGSPISIPDDAEEIVCPSCSSTLAIERDKGYITLKVMEKLADSIKENAYVTQIELRRMQISQMISMEEMKINTIQAEIRDVKRRLKPGEALNNEISELLLREIDIRMSIRSLKMDIAHLEPGWEESLDVIRRDILILDEAIKSLMPYVYIPRVKDRTDQLTHEKNKCIHQYNILEEKLLHRNLQSIEYPSFDNLTIEEMEELLEKIPQDLDFLKQKEQSYVKLEIQKRLNETLAKIKECYPRKKIESQVGKLPSLDFHQPYPEDPDRIGILVSQIEGDLEKLTEIPSSPIKEPFIQDLSKKLTYLRARANENIPGKKARKKKLSVSSF